MPVIPALRRLKQKDHKLQTSLGYTARPCKERKEKGKREREEKGGEEKPAI
jgi:hypothetical protein